MSQTTSEDVARAFHEAYERLAPAHGYETREASARPWADVPAGNKALMIATVGALFDDGVIGTPTPFTFSGMGFGDALRFLRNGECQLARGGWNGKDMFIVYQAGYPDGIAINANTAKATGVPEGTVCKFRPYLMMKTVDDDFVPWVASQTDLLADDWYVVSGRLS